MRARGTAGPNMGTPVLPNLQYRTYVLSSDNLEIHKKFTNLKVCGNRTFVLCEG